ncbi:endonuclease/exonuclease/phosphatase family protein [Tuwongella immobilis]|uniref:Endonuclease/exonuclease/phosphatase domain-containing protein n=1 Tax=Tuwongella immobilis TaxID=692036 RepID=A0A6C2YIY0_9BACT|nr:endonuclease/exonuclease/phosphatase family protein [Tuwongella immobilis]VIP01500.1 Endonuclease/exonuclease/phosphatase OS=Isosphaera pallida (strain ATCC 43644 / DSM 9630 / IS1B) GN=Isop_3176 PE=4 SV=1: Exo_endo_phos [Tuwongella immobilis]VTR98592.1 Endonuclease/exonuclease/phosphatase OS=Isosphaera pallida (strain ATCC 43644 / DSM 9630 / IS1B) GN=Isop_3176 PE=4 SV=1: Exo_endo_phos [Tuwongella immobilis]
MARSRSLGGELAKQPPWVIALVLIVLAIVALVNRSNNPAEAPPARPLQAGEYFFAFWNVENLYDDQDDPKLQDEMDDWYPTDPAAWKLKLDRLAEAILAMNQNRGPDILAMVEVESERALEALQTTINARLKANGRDELAYPYRLFREDNTGRRFAPAILSRVPVDNNRTRKVGGNRNGRMLVGRLEANGHELIVFPAHWTSRVSDKDGSRRMSYAESMYGEYREMVTANRNVDVLLCGDWNDDFTDPSIQQGLHGVDSAEKLRAPGDLRTWVLTSRFDVAKEGTLAYRNKWNVFDHLAVSPGMLDSVGWSVLPESVAIFHTPEMRKGRLGEPRPFGDAKTRPEERGYSDHFPVTVILKLNQP